MKYKACDILLNVCAKCQKEEKILIVTDPGSLEVAMALWEDAAEFPNKSLVMMPMQTTHGQEPTELVRAAMMEADVIFRVTTFSISNTKARREACANGARDVNCADYDMRMLSSGGLYADFVGLIPLVNRTAERLRGKEIHITTKLGTDVTARIEGREPIAANAVSWEPGVACFPPDVECAIGAINGTANGVLYVDGSVPHPLLGPIKEPIRIEIEGSKLVKITGGEEAERLKTIFASANDPEHAYYMGEIGLGMNPACSLSGRMLEDEGCAKTIHFGIGDDCAFGGNNKCGQHIDLVFCEPTIWVDGIMIMKDGTVVE